MLEKSKLNISVSDILVLMEFVCFSNANAGCFGKFHQIIDFFIYFDHLSSIEDRDRSNYLTMVRFPCMLLGQYFSSLLQLCK